MSTTNGVMGLTSLPLLLSQHLQASFIVAALIIYSASLFWTAYVSALRSIPGPPGARFSRLWLFRQSMKGNAHTLYTDLHRRYGKIVRVGPNKVSISDSEMIPVIYGISSKYNKVGWSHSGDIHLTSYGIVCILRCVHSYLRR